MKSSRQIIAKKSRRRNSPAARDLALQVAALGEAAFLRMPANDTLLGLMGGVLNVARGAMERQAISNWLRDLAKEIDDDSKPHD